MHIFKGGITTQWQNQGDKELRAPSTFNVDPGNGALKRAYSPAPGSPPRKPRSLPLRNRAYPRAEYLNILTGCSALFQVLCHCGIVHFLVPRYLGSLWGNPAPWEGHFATAESCLFPAPNT